MRRGLLIWLSARTSLHPHWSGLWLRPGTPRPPPAAWSPAAKQVLHPLPPFSYPWQLHHPKKVFVVVLAQLTHAMVEPGPNFVRCCRGGGLPSAQPPPSMARNGPQGSGGQHPLFKRLFPYKLNNIPVGWGP